MTAGSRNNIFGIWIDTATRFFKEVVPTYTSTGTVSECLDITAQADFSNPIGNDVIPGKF